ncbi:macrolide family glycosyltransferase [Pseudonocardia sp. ICBG162]|uniref:macrolide family glycosyltransferase n=1 Tax=Pseudonocardia sp. ICBG162 TaxID=2846761 RepID=UPI001CF6DEC8|nr:macrolide family glycosyltransferase [Pseudonocardia sp. ICBG162]
MSSDIVLVSMPAAGHVLPTLPLVAELVRRGHRVRYATGATMVDAVRAAGAEPLEVPFVLPGPPGPDGNHLGFFAGSLEAVHPVLTAAIGRDRPDVVCGDALIPVGSLAAQACDLPFVCLRPSMASNAHFSMRDLVPPDDPANRAMMAAFAANHERMAAFARSHGLEPVPFGSPAELSLVFVPREFQIAGDTFDESFVFCGPCLGERAHQRWDGPELADPLLLVSLGTAFNDRAEFFRTCAEAFDDGAWQVVMAVGERIDPAALGPLPRSVVVRPHVPQIALLRRARAFVTHNGMGSTLEALLFGVPQVGVPQMVEQWVNAGRVQELGLGRRLDDRTPDAATLRRAVDEVAGDPAVRSAAAALGERMREVDGPALGADALERFTGR